jgi:hypothetical protein
MAVHWTPSQRANQPTKEDRPVEGIMVLVPSMWSRKNMCKKEEHGIEIWPFLWHHAVFIDYF